MSDGELRQTMKRLMSIHDEIDEKKLDLKSVYADAKSAGFDKAALGLAIRQIRGREKAETPAAEERAAIVDLYVSAFDSAPLTYVHVPAREGTYPERVSRPVETAGSASSLSGNAAEKAPVAQPTESEHVDRSASAQPHSAEGGPAIPSKPGDAGTGQGADDEAALAAVVQPSGAGTGSAVRSGAPISIRGLAEANAIAARAVKPGPTPTRNISGDMPEIPAFLRRAAPGNHPSFGEQA